MRVLVDGKVHEPLSPAEEQDVRQFRAEETVEGAVLSADQATTAQGGQARLVFMILWGVTAIVAAVIASVAGPADQAVVFVAAFVITAALGAFFALVLWRRRRRWQQDLPRHLAGLAPANTAIGVTAAGIAVAGQVFPWSTLAIDQVEFAKLGTRHRTMFTLERLALAGPGGIVVLDPALMRNGHRIIGNAWRRMRQAGPN
jgi:4-amino-4-deoxy-L-arabinose transferase-like glycosyltransferase